jgi:hypothetical protein
MATTKERLEQLENAILVLAGGGAGFAAGRMGTAPAAKAAARSPVGQALLAGFTLKEIREELNAMDAAAAEQEFGPLAGRATELVQRISPLPVPVAQATIAGLGLGKKARKKTKTKFNRAISAGMKAVRNSTSYGKKGTINNSKKAFSAVTKTASKINKGGKVAKKGITRKIGLAVKRILG